MSDRQQIRHGSAGAARRGRGCCWRGARACAGAAGAAPRPTTVFTVGNYPVEARADNAVAAKDQGAGRRPAGRLPLAAEAAGAGDGLPAPQAAAAVKAGDLVEGVKVRSERNSSTDYIASLDFSFQSKAVRDLLRREGIPFTDEQAPARHRSFRSGARPAPPRRRTRPPGPMSGRASTWSMR